jgi:hypothetical protein
VDNTKYGIIVRDMECKASAHVECSKHLLVDCTEFGALGKKGIENYRQVRRQISGMMKNTDKEQMRHVGPAPSLWFDNVFFAYRDCHDEVIVTK